MATIGSSDLSLHQRHGTWICYQVTVAAMATDDPNDVASGDFPAGTQLLVDPCAAFMVDAWMVARSRVSDDPPWIAWGRAEGSTRLLDRLNGELHVYDASRYDILFVIVGVLSPPPRPASAH
jgi:hypothetical protein